VLLHEEDISHATARIGVIGIEPLKLFWHTTDLAKNAKHRSFNQW
jgi:hypothetical protein